ncbi:MAG TPA: alpha-amylase family glycosyl hydrolase [Candidatus Limnocylindria bacterium]|nr:alpha-amylase family glycosyl hydrolase [Candidatus Limnocylindria bacterium]
MKGSWWQNGVIYQVYPRSFADSNGDGVGDLPGVKSRLDHLRWLGVDALWLSPIFPSPMADFGYDVADYTDVDPACGSLADFDGLVAAAHERGLRVVLDFVPNHTSDQHPWFVDARSSRLAEHRDWYIWRDALPGGGPPNDWQSAFGGSAWEWDKATGQYYFHSFLKEQPDLDWRKSHVRAAMGDVLRFWFKRGVDGFRVDVIWLLAKGTEIEAGKVFGGEKGGGSGGDQPEIHRYINELRSVAEEFNERLLIGEIYLPLERLMHYYGEAADGLHLPFNFQLLLIDWQAEAVHRTVKRYEELLPAHAWPNWVLGNHDNSRVASRQGPAQARVAATLLFTLRGTPTLYYGDEIGMQDVDVPPTEQRDPQGLRGAGASRDPARTPMRWTPEPGAGFSAGRPWLPVGTAVETVNVATQHDEPDSMLALHRRLLALRRREPALHAGAWKDLGREGSIIAYLRADGERRLMVALNLGDEAGPLPVAARGMAGPIQFATSVQREGGVLAADATLPGNEALVVQLN